MKLKKAWSPAMLRPHTQNSKYSNLLYMRTLYLLPLMFVSSCLFACNCHQTQMQRIEQDIPKGDSMKLKITVGEKVIMATLYNNSTSKDFITLLPLTTTLEDYVNTEKIHFLTKKLSVDNSQKPGQVTGDIAYYVPWGNLAIFYTRNASSADGFIILGKIDSGKEALNVTGDIKVKIELVRNK